MNDLKDLDKFSSKIAKLESHCSILNLLFLLKDKNPNCRFKWFNDGKDQKLNLPISLKLIKNLINQRNTTNKDKMLINNDKASFDPSISIPEDNNDFLSNAKSFHDHRNFKTSILLI